MGFHIYLCVMLIILTQSSGDSSEDQHQFGYNQAYAPPSVVFHDIYPPGHAALSEDPASAATDEDFRLNTISTQFVEFHPQVLKIQPITPPPRILLNSSYVKVKEDNASISTTTHEPEEMTIKVVPMKHYQRGVLDLLLPASRVRTFKNVFDTVRRMLSYTFRRR